MRRCAAPSETSLQEHNRIAIPWFALSFVSVEEMNSLA